MKIMSDDREVEHKEMNEEPHQIEDDKDFDDWNQNLFQ